MDLSTITNVYKFVQDHWETVAAVAAFVTGTGGAAVALAAKNKAYGQLFTLSLSLIEEVALQELSGAEKRKWVADTAWDASPAWVKKVISETQVEDIVEKAYQQFKAGK